MKGSLALIIFILGLAMVLLHHDVLGQNIRVTKTCGSGKKKSSMELKEMKRRAIEKALKKTEIAKNMKTVIEQQQQNAKHYYGTCHPRTYKYLLLSF